MEIINGKPYIYDNEKAFPTDMNGASVVTESVSSDKSSIGYSFTKISGITGSGSMSLEHAKKHFREVN